MGDQALKGEPPALVHDIKESPKADADGPGSGAECPICAMFKEGGCKDQFDGFMDCGIEAEKGGRDYQDCVKMFDAMRECMLRNPAVFGPMLADVDDAVGSGSREGGSSEAPPPK